MVVEGLMPTLIAGVAGGVISELIHIATALKGNRRPSGLELLGSFILALLGGGAVIYGTGERTLFEAATLGAAFPLLFGQAVRLATEQKGKEEGKTLGPRQAVRDTSLLDWVGKRG